MTASRIDKDSKDARNKRIAEMWLACYSEQEIASQVGCDQKTVSNIIGEKYSGTEFLKPAYLHQDESFEIPLYNIWKQQTNPNPCARTRECMLPPQPSMVPKTHITGTIGNIVYYHYQ